MISQQSTLTLFIGGIIILSSLAIATARQQHNVANIEWTKETNSMENDVRAYCCCFFMISLMYKYTC